MKNKSSSKIDSALLISVLVPCVVGVILIMILVYMYRLRKEPKAYVPRTTREVDSDDEELGQQAGPVYTSNANLVSESNGNQTGNSQPFMQTVEIGGPGLRQQHTNTQPLSPL
jgi:hypothetical protein